MRSNMDNKYVDEMNEIKKYIEHLERKLQEIPEAALEETAAAMLPYTVYIERANIQIGIPENPPHPAKS